MQRYSGRIFACVSVLLLLVCSGSESRSGHNADYDWPWWRGPALDGKGNAQDSPLEWSRTNNVLWRSPVPGRGHSSPIVYGNAVYLTTADDSSKKQSVIAYDRHTGKQLWQTTAHTGGFMPKHDKNTHASATSACDGKHVYSVFIQAEGLQVTAMDLNGAIVWQSTAGSFRSEHGYGSSPVLYRSLVIVLGDNLKSSFIAALDRDTGKTVWRTDRKTTGKHGSYATPVVAQVAGKSQLLVSGMDTTDSYDPDSGRPIWSCQGPAEVTACTPAFSDSLVFSSGGYPQKELLAIRADGSGDITRSHVAWRNTKGVTYVPSPLYHSGRLYVIADNGVATCFDAERGTQVWQGRIEGNFSSSPVQSGDRIFITNEAGRTYVLRTGDKFEVLAQNDLGDGGFASPALCGPHIFVRTNSQLYCIGSPARQ